MSNLQRLNKNSYGICQYISKQYPNIKFSLRKYNKIMVKYLKEFNKPYKRWNNRYKGLFTADLINGNEIQNDFNHFANWIKSIPEKTIQDI